MQRIETDILILGGGWSGLVAADLISANYGNKKVVILEKENDIGGLARTFHFRGFRFDIGGHRLCFRGDDNIIYLKKIVSESSLLCLKTRAKILFNDKYINYPVSLSSILKINKKLIFKILFEIFTKRKKRKEENFEDWIVSNYGETLFNIYFKDYTEKVWGKACAELSPCWAGKRIGRCPLWGSIKNIFLRDGVKENISLFYYPRLGMGALMDSLKHRVTNHSTIYNNVRLDKFFANGKILKSLSFVSNGQDFEIDFKKVISTIPLRELISALPNDNGDILGEEKNGLKYRSLILAGVVINKALVTDWHWCYFPAKTTIFSRLHEPKFWSPDMGPKNKSLLSLEIFCDYNDNLWNKDDAELRKQIVDSLYDTKIIACKGEVVDMCIKKIEYAYPLHYKGFEKPLGKIKNFLSSYVNLSLAGRNGTHSYFDMEECIDDIKYKLRAL